MCTVKYGLYGSMAGRKPEGDVLHVAISLVEDTANMQKQVLVRLGHC